MAAEDIVAHIAGQAAGSSIEPGRVLVRVASRDDELRPVCGYYEQRDDGVYGCDAPQGEGPLWFYVPVVGGAVRVPVCVHHADHLTTYHGAAAGGAMMARR